MSDGRDLEQYSRHCARCKVTSAVFLEKKTALRPEALGIPTAIQLQLRNHKKEETRDSSPPSVLQEP